MDHKDCLILKTVREVKTLTKTSQRLFISQPALTYRLQNLEKELGVPLVIRTNAGVVFTPQGKLLCDYAEDTLSRWEKVTHDIKEIAAEIKGSMRLGVSSIIAQRRLAPLLKGFQSAHPFATFNLHIGSSTQMLPQMLMDNDVDVVILRGELPEHDTYHVIDEEPLGVVTATPFSMEVLPQTSWIRYVPSTITRSEKQSDRWWREHFTDPHDAIVRTDSTEAALQMVSYGLGWCISSRLHVRPHPQLFFTPITFKDGTPLTHKTLLAYNEDFVKTPLGKSFISYVHQNYHKVK